MSLKTHFYMRLRKTHSSKMYVKSVLFRFSFRDVRTPEIKRFSRPPAALFNSCFISDVRMAHPWNCETKHWNESVSHVEKYANEAEIVSVFCFSFYRAMHFSAKRGIAIACRMSVCLSVCPSVRPSVCDVGELWSHRLEFFKNNFRVS